MRLLTLTGPGGVGKTRLALAIAQHAAPLFPDGVIFVSLAAISDPELVVPTIARTLGLGEASVRSPLELIGDAISAQRLLLVLNNVEQVQPAAIHVAELLATCPHLVILATSRTLLHIAGEQRFPVTPLALPVVGPGPTAEEQVSAIASAAAVQLFMARAQAVTPSFTLSPDNAQAIAAICHRLDGLPLAIELATARLRLLSPRELLARFRAALPLLTEGPLDAPDRLRTMRQAIAWSYDLLTTEEQELFRRLAVFTGGFALEAAEWVADGEAEGGRRRRERALDGELARRQENPSPSVLDLVASLVDKSLLTRSEEADESRFWMLETIREFGLEQLIRRWRGRCDREPACGMVREFG